MVCEEYNRDKVKFKIFEYYQSNQMLFLLDY